MIRGVVVEGQKLGRELGFPTLNLDPLDSVCWPQGVYACLVWVLGVEYRGVLHWGVKGGAGEPVLEVHVFDFAEDVYGQEVELEFKELIREVRQFTSLEELKEQIAADVVAAKAVFR